jgi:hypothetical protein
VIHRLTVVSQGLRRERVCKITTIDFDLIHFAPIFSSLQIAFPPIAQTYLSHTIASLLCYEHLTHPPIHLFVRSSIRPLLFAHQSLSSINEARRNSKVPTPRHACRATAIQIQPSQSIKEAPANYQNLLEQLTENP